ncbi:MAG: SDR family NAD(P)-dependent oxidoreductase [Actinobacteria bacterium]|nr:SDR family NAD(P)-dependent oxidoreductase [Actinomycetota bacterium]
MDLTGKVAIVTGAGRGLGRSYALALAERGAQVVVNDLGTAVDGSGSDVSSADTVAAEIRDLGGTAVAEHSSVATRVGGIAIVDRALEEFGQLDVLVNNAGNIELCSFAKLDLESIDRILDVHLGGAFYVTQPAYRAMLPRKSGSIIFTASGVASFGNLGASVYGAGKGGILGLLSVLKLEAARHGIRVNAVAPMAQTRMAADASLDEYNAVSEAAVGPDLCAPPVVYFASDECDLTGEVWSVASGSVARLFVGRTVGYFKNPDTKGPLSPEDVAEHVDQIRDLDGYSLPPTWPAEWEMVLEMFRQDQA